MDERTQQLRERSRQQLEQLRNGVRNLHKVYYGDLPRPYQFAWNLLDDPEAAARRTTEYSDNYRVKAPAATTPRHMPQGPSPTGVMDVASETYSHRELDSHRRPSHSRSQPEVTAYESDHDHAYEGDHHEARSAFDNHSADEESEHDGRHHHEGEEDFEGEQEHHDDDRAIRDDEHYHRRYEPRRQYVEEYRGGDSVPAPPRATEEPVLQSSAESSPREYGSVRSRSAPPRRGCDPRWSTEYTDRFRWWPTVGHEQRQPPYICPDGRPEVPPHHVDLAPQQIASPWRTEYQDAFAWVGLMSATATRAEGVVPEPSAANPEITSSPRASPYTMTADSLNDAIRRAEIEGERRSPRAPVYESVYKPGHEAVHEPVHQSRDSPRAERATPARTQPAKRPSSSGRRNTGRRTHSSAAPAPGAATTTTHRKHSATAPASHPSVPTRPRTHQRRRSGTAVRPPRHDIITSNVRYPDLSDKQLGRWRTEYSRSYHWPLEK